jgi:hypothetical protein
VFLFLPWNIWLGILYIILLFQCSFFGISIKEQEIKYPVVSVEFLFLLLWGIRLGTGSKISCCFSGAPVLAVGYPSRNRK